jgi:predicted porin
LQGGRFFGRQATLGVSRDSFFVLLAGRQLTVSTLYMLPIDPLNLNFGQANMGASFGSVNTVRYDSLIQFQTEDWNGLRAGIGYSFNTGQSALYQSGTFSEKVPASEFFGTSANMRAVTAGVQYSSGPWDVAITYDRVFGASSLPDISGSQVVANPVSASPTAWILGASYDFGVIRVAGAFGRTYDGAFTGQHVGHGVAGSGLETITKGQGMRFTPGFDSQSVMLGFAIPIDEDSNLMFSAQVMQPKGSLVGNDFYATQRIVGMAYTYAISRRTNLYLWGSYGENFQMARSAKSGGVGAGVRYLF